MIKVFWRDLSWNPNLELKAEEWRDGCLLVTFQLGNPILKLQVTKDLFEVLINNFDNSNQLNQNVPNSLPIANGRFLKFVDLLLERQILMLRPTSQGTIDIYTDSKTKVQSWCLPALRKMKIDLLIGDEISLVTHSHSFLKERSVTDRMLSFIKICPDQVEIGPLRFYSEVQMPRTRGTVPTYFPSWRQCLEASLVTIREVFQEALTGVNWYPLTVSGCRRTRKWEEARPIFRLETSIVSQPEDCVPFFQYQARVENEEAAGGSGETAAIAEYSAKCEAWERFCLARPDLAVQADEGFGRVDLDHISGPYFNYLRKLAPPLPKGPKWCQGWTLAGQEPVKVPAEWIYFSGESGAVNTNGAAYGSLLEDAYYSAKNELIERHLFLKAYLRKSCSKEFNPENYGFDSDNSRSNMRNNQRQPRWYHLGECNGVQGVLCIVSSDTPPFVSTGTAARASLVEAAKKALYEALITDYLWSHRIEQHGVQKFLHLGRELMNQPSKQIGFEESAWVWATMSEAQSMLHSIFHSGEPKTENLSESGFIGVDVGKNILTTGAVVKVLHPDALPLPSYYSHAKILFNLMGVTDERNDFLSLPIPMN